MRELILLIDFSVQMKDDDIDYKPNKAYYILENLKSFVHHFYEQNPLAKLSMILLRDERAEIISRLDNNPNSHYECLKKMIKSNSGDHYNYANKIRAMEEANKNNDKIPSGNFF